MAHFWKKLWPLVFFIPICTYKFVIVSSQEDIADSRCDKNVFVTICRFGQQLNIVAGNVVLIVILDKRRTVESVVFWRQKSEVVETVEDEPPRRIADDL